MLKQKRDSNTPDVYIERTRFADSNLQLRVYYIRIHDVTNSVTMKMKFGDGITFQFEPARQMNRINPYGPFIYAVNLNLLMSKDKLYVQHEPSLRLVNAYRLQMSYPVPVLGHCVFDEKDDRVHTLKDCFDKQYCFLFDIRFSSKFKLNAPGRILSNIER
jgi:hypothetical protein